MKKIVACLSLLTWGTLSLNAGEHDQVILVQQAQTPMPPLNLNDLPLTNEEKAELETVRQTAHNKAYGYENSSVGARYGKVADKLGEYSKVRLRKNDAAGYVMLSAAASGFNTRSEALSKGYPLDVAVKLGAQKEVDLLRANTRVKTPDGKTTDLTTSRKFKEHQDRRARSLKAEINATKPSAPSPHRSAK